MFIIIIIIEDYLCKLVGVVTEQLLVSSEMLEETTQIATYSVSFEPPIPTIHFYLTQTDDIKVISATVEAIPELL